MAEAKSPGMREVILQEAGSLSPSGFRPVDPRRWRRTPGVSKAGLYYHFRDKEALFLAILTSNLDNIEQLMRDARQAPTTRAQVEQMVHAIFQRAPEQRGPHPAGQPGDGSPQPGGARPVRPASTTRSSLARWN